MKRFTHIITNPNGLDVRCASLLVKMSGAMDSSVALHKAGGNSAVATNLMALMGINLKQGDTVEVSVGLGSEDVNAAVVEQFIKDYL